MCNCVCEQSHELEWAGRVAGTRAEGSREDGPEVLVEGPGRETHVG